MVNTMRDILEESRKFMIAELIELYNKLDDGQRRKFKRIYPQDFNNLSAIDIVSAFNVCQHALKD